MPGPPPKPDSQRRRRNRPGFEWTELPAEGRKGRPPKLPPIRAWSDETKRWWRELWKTPQATAWDQQGRSAVPMAILYQDMQDRPADSKPLLAEMRAHQDRHGLSPKALLALRWRVEETPEAPAPVSSPQQPTNRRANVLRLLGHNDGDRPDAS